LAEREQGFAETSIIAKMRNDEGASKEATLLDSVLPAKIGIPEFRDPTLDFLFPNAFDLGERESGSGTKKK